MSVAKNANYARVEWISASTAPRGSILRIEDEVRQLLARTLARDCLRAAGDRRFGELVDAVADRRIDPRGAVEALIHSTRA